MSLRAFHILLILATLACFAFLSYWAGNRVALGENGQNAALAAGAAACFLVGSVYLGWFLRKTRTPRA